MATSNKQMLHDRVEREKAAYDEGLKRERYDRVLAHGYVDHHYWKHRYAMIGERLRAAPPQRALELGSVTWRRFLEDNNVIPAETVCINISEAELIKGKNIAENSRVSPRFQLMDAHDLSFPDNYFDLVFGVAVLHHLNLEIAYAEIARVLKPNGLMIFVEPLNLNPVAKLVRHLTPHARTPDEAAFDRPQLALTTARFDCQLHYEQLSTVLFGAVARPLIADPDNFLTRFAFRFDQGLKRMIPVIGPYYRRVLIIGRNRAPHR
jgi:SAM-dependent methyltransferase